MAVAGAGAETASHRHTAAAAMSTAFWSPSSLSRRGFIGWLGAAAGLAGTAEAATPAVRPMLAREAPAGIDPTGYLVSEKLDGVRGLWDGRALRFRNGGQIAAPRWFTAVLPPVALDGELWLARGQFQRTSGIVRRQLPVEADWRQLRYALFDLPGAAAPFAVRVERLEALAGRAARQAGWVQVIPQERLATPQALTARLDAVVAAGGEGLMLHRADAWHAPGRSDALLKLKPLYDAEAVVIGHAPGKGRHAGRLGALRVRSEAGIAFEIGTGLSDQDRLHPPAVGQVVTFTHQGYTAGGVPRFASFLRVREGG